MESRMEAVQIREKTGNALLGWIAYKYPDFDAFPGGEVSIMLVNDTMGPWTAYH